MEPTDALSALGISEANVFNLVLVVLSCVIVSTLSKRTERIGWRDAVTRDLDLYETLSRHAKTEKDRRTAEAVRREAFWRAAKAMDGTRPAFAKSALAQAFRIAPGLCCAVIALFFLFVFPGVSSADLNARFLYLLALPVAALFDLIVSRSGEREGAHAEDGKDGREEEVDEREEDEEVDGPH